MVASAFLTLDGPLVSRNWTLQAVRESLQGIGSTFETFGRTFRTVPRTFRTYADRFDNDGVYRDLFPVTRNLVYFNHAAVGPLSVRACEAMKGHARDQRDFGALHWKEWYAEIDRLRESAARLIGAQPG